jgi:hypothetical protein
MPSLEKITAQSRVKYPYNVFFKLYVSIVFIKGTDLLFCYRQKSKPGNVNLMIQRNWKTNRLIYTTI